MHSATDTVLAAMFMSKIDRLFEVVQVLRRAKKPLTARELAEKVEVSLRTIYRDCAALQGMGIPIEGAPGIGYVMRRGYDLPPLAFTPIEQEAIVTGLSMLGRTGDPILLQAADEVVSKLSTAASIKERRNDATRFVSQAGAPQADMNTAVRIRDAIAAEQKLDIVYHDRNSDPSRRTVWPLCLIYYPDASVLTGWCELREDFRHFRMDRLRQVELLADHFRGRGGELRREWRLRENWPQDYRGAI